MKRWTLFALICLCGADVTTAADSLLVAQGEMLFTQNCKACHHLEMRLVGPALKGVENRHSEAWLLKFIRSSQTMVQSGDSVAVSLFNTYNKVIMPDQPLDEAQIKSVLAYIAGAGKPVIETGDIPRPAVTPISASDRPLKFSDYRFWIIYTVTVLLVIVSIYYKAELIALGKQAGIGE